MSKSTKGREDLVAQLERIQQNLPRWKAVPQVHTYMLDAYVNRLDKLRTEYGITEEWATYKNWYKAYLGIEEL